MSHQHLMHLKTVKHTHIVGREGGGGSIKRIGPMLFAYISKGGKYHFLRILFCISYLFDEDFSKNLYKSSKN